jgi:TatD DNase family protein
MNRNRNEVIPIKPENDLPLVDCHAHFPEKEPYRKTRYTHEEEYDYFFKKHNGQFIIHSGSDYNYEYVQPFIQSHENMYFTLGCLVPDNRYSLEESLDEYGRFLDIAENKKETYVALGEHGLDFHRAKTLKVRKQQIDFIQKLINETKHLDKPYVLHIRNATQRDVDQRNPNHEYNQRDFCNKTIVRILEEEKVSPDRVMWHCFSGPTEWGPKLAEKGYYISIPSSAYGFNRWRRNIKGVPMDRLLTETDACMQHPFKMGAYNTPANVKYTIAAIAYVNEMDQYEVAEQVVENARRFFDIR